MTAAEEDAYHELCAYTLTHRDPSFLHQHVVDAYAAQSATPESKAISVAFALFGLYLHVERGFTGREVQLAHMALARTRRSWPSYALPDSRGDMTASDVMLVPPGPERDAAIHQWSASVWRAFLSCRTTVIDQLKTEGMVR